MLKLIKISIIFVILTACVSNPDIARYEEETIIYNPATYIRFSGEDYVPSHKVKQISKKRTKTVHVNPKKLNRLDKKYKRLKTGKGMSTQEKMLADLRGVLSDDVYAQLEETQTRNPIKGYNEINQDSLQEEEMQIAENKTIEKIKPVKKPIIKTKKTTKKRVFKTPPKKASLKITKENLIGLSEKEILKILKKPSDIEKNNQMILWKYSNNTCQAQFYFYADSCLFIETAFNKKGFNNPNSCLKTFGI